MVKIMTRLLCNNNCSCFYLFHTCSHILNITGADGASESKVSFLWQMFLCPQPLVKRDALETVGSRLSVFEISKKTCIWKYRLFMSSAEYSCKLFLRTFQAYFCIQANSVDPDQTAPLAVWSGAILFAKITFKITSRWQSRRQLLWLAV